MIWKILQYLKVKRHDIRWLVYISILFLFVELHYFRHYLHHFLNLNNIMFIKDKFQNTILQVFVRSGILIIIDHL